jgi:hypothetical protein
MTDDVKVFGLANGMELIGTITSETADKFQLKNALALNVQQGQGPNGELRLQLIPPTFFSSAENGGRKGADIELYKGNILFCYSLREDIMQQYVTQTGKIIIASAI